MKITLKKDRELDNVVRKDGIFVLGFLTLVGMLFGAVIPVAYAENHMMMHATSSTNMRGQGLNNTSTIMVMKHKCNESIRTLADFEALEQGKAPVAALVATVLACPTTGLPGDMPVPGTVAADRQEFMFEVKGSMGEEMDLHNALFEQVKLSEVDVNIDANGDGSISTTTALDVSHYVFSNVKGARVNVRETEAPAGSRFGTVRFTPSVIDGNNDKDTLQKLDVEEGLIRLNMTKDNDDMVMLHVYNFAGEADMDDDNDQNINSLRIQINELKRTLDRILELLSTRVGNR